LVYYSESDNYTVEVYDSESDSYIVVVYDSESGNYTVEAYGFESDNYTVVVYDSVADNYKVVDMPVEKGYMALLVDSLQQQAHQQLDSMESTVHLGTVHLLLVYHT